MKLRDGVERWEARDGVKEGLHSMRPYARLDVREAE